MNLSISELISRSLSPDPRLSPEEPGGREDRSGAKDDGGGKVFPGNISVFT